MKIGPYDRTAQIRSRIYARLGEFVGMKMTEEVRLQMRAAAEDELERMQREDGGDGWPSIGDVVFNPRTREIEIKLTAPMMFARYEPSESAPLSRAMFADTLASLGSPQYLSAAYLNAMQDVYAKDVYAKSMIRDLAAEKVPEARVDRFAALDLGDDDDPGSRK